MNEELTGPQGGAPDDAAEKKRESKWERTFEIKCDTPFQKAKIKEKADKANLSVTRYMIRRALAEEAPSDELWKQRAEAAEEQLHHYRDARVRAEAEAEDLRRRLRDLEKQGGPVPVTDRARFIAARAGLDLKGVGPRALFILQASSRMGEPAPVLMRDIVVELDLDSTGIGLLREFLQILGEWGVVERTDKEGKTAYLWKVPRTAR